MSNFNFNFLSGPWLPGGSLFSSPKPPELPKKLPPPPPAPTRKDVRKVGIGPAERAVRSKRVGRRAMILAGAEGDLSEVPLGRPSAKLGV